MSEATVTATGILLDSTPVTVDAKILLPSPLPGERFKITNGERYPVHVGDCAFGASRPRGTSRQRAATLRKRAQLRARCDYSTITLHPGEAATITAGRGGWWAEETP